MDISWGCGWFLATLFVVTNLIGQLGAVAMVLTRCPFLDVAAYIEPNLSSDSKWISPVAFFSSLSSFRFESDELDMLEY